MDLKEFIKVSLVEICEGIAEAQKHVEANNLKASINHPDHVTGRGESVDFDIAVTVSSSKTNEASGKLTVMEILKVGGGMENSTADSSVSRLKFSIPVNYPTQGTLSPRKVAAS